MTESRFVYSLKPAHPQDAHKRVMSIAAVQEQLHASGIVGPIDMLPYLSRLSDILSTSMISDTRHITIKVVGEGGTATSRDAERLGLIATELVMNALKHAFATEKNDGRIVMAYNVDGTNWKLSVADNGVVRPDGFCSIKNRTLNRHRKGAGATARCQV